jgi:hypothetical protein
MALVIAKNESTTDKNGKQECVNYDSQAAFFGICHFDSPIC